MKITILSLLFCSVLQAQSDLPSKHEALTENYERAVERLTKPLTSKYIEELKKIQQELSGKDDHEGAQEVKTKLKELGAIPWDLAEVLKSKSWEYTANTSTSLMVFRDDGTVEVTGGEVEVWEWTVKEGNILQIQYTSDKTCDFNFADFTDFSIVGVTNEGKRRFLEPHKPSGQP
jgi:hypothetical protein